MVIQPNLLNDYLIFSAKTIGASHIINNVPYQDSVLCVEAEQYKLITVCDGHGGDDYFRSDRGSKFASDSFSKCIADAFSTDNQPTLKNILADCTSLRERNDIFRRFMQNFLYRWILAVNKDIEDNPFTDEEMNHVPEKRKMAYKASVKPEQAYGTTFIGVVITDSFWFGIQIGDGDCICLDNSGEMVRPIPDDDACVDNITTSLCDTDAVNEARYYYSKELPLAIFVASDGISKSFNREKAMYDFFRNIISNFIKKGNKATEELEEYLPKLSKQGSKDDISIGGLMNIDRTKNNKDYLIRKKEKFLNILRMGNLGADKMDSDYCQKAHFIVTQDMTVLDLRADFCAGFGSGIQAIEIVSIADDNITLKVGEYVLTMTNKNNIQELSFSEETALGKQLDIIILHFYQK